MTAGADGLFAEHQIDVDIADPPGGPENIKQVAGGDRDFCLTSVHHFLTARAEAGGLAARFVAIVVQRSPLAAFVPEQSPITEPHQLAGVRLGGSADANHTLEFLATLAHLGIGAPTPVTMVGPEAHVALGAGEVDAIVGFSDGLPRSSRLAGVPLRAIPVGLDIYASGLVAADRISFDTVARMRAALCEALERQRQDPRSGLDEMCLRYPETVPDEALEGWRLLEPNVFTGAEPGSMAPSRWEATLAFLTAARGLPRPDPDSVYRADFAAELDVLSVQDPTKASV